MRTTRRTLLIGASTAAFATTAGRVAFAKDPIKIGVPTALTGDIGLRLSAMDAQGIDFQVLSPSPLTYFHFIDAGEASAYCCAWNDALAAAAPSGGRWLLVKTEESKSKDNPKPTVSQQVWGWSREQTGLVQNGADNHGGFYAGTSTGWVGERLSWVTDAARGAKRAKLKQSFTKQGKDLALEIALDPSGSGDAYRVTFEGLCKK